MASGLLTSGSKILASRVMQAVFNAVTGIMIARFLGPDGQGQYSLIITMILFLATLMNGGLGLASVPLLGQGKVRLFNVIKAQAVWVVGCVIVLSLLYTSLRFENSLSITAAINQEHYPVIFAGVLVLLCFDLLFYNMIGVGRVLIGPIANLIRAALYLLIVLFGATNLSLYSAVLFWVIAQSVAVTVIFISSMFTKPQANILPFPVLSLAKKLFQDGWIGQLSSVASILHLRLNLYLVVFFIGKAETGIYSMAVLVGEFLWLLSGSLQPVVARSTAQLGFDRDLVTARAVRVAIAVTLWAAIAMAFAAAPLFSIVFDGKYNGSIIPLYLILPGIVIFAAGAVLAGDFIGRGKTVWNTQASILTLVMNVLAGLFLIPKYGVAGAAISSTVAYTIGTIFMLYRFTSISKLSVKTIFSLKKEDFLRN